LSEFIEIKYTKFTREIITDFSIMERARVSMEVGPLAIGKYPVTNYEYYLFIEETGYWPKGDMEDMFLAHWKDGKHPPQDKLSHPVTFVSYDDALVYAEFVKGRLPTYSEWLYAAFGDTDNQYPWGNEFFSDLCNVRKSGNKGTTPVGLFSPKGDSPVGCCDMIGNVWEWTSTSLDEDEDIFLALGTGWDHYCFQLEIPLDRWYRNHSVGFRVVKERKR